MSIKEKVNVERPSYLVANQKLIFSGKVLKDTQTLDENGFKENDFLVCMVTKEVAKVQFIILIQAIILTRII